MKKFSIYISILLSINLFAQNNELSSSARWYISTSAKNMSDGCYSIRDFNQYFKNDTIINGNQYFIVSEVGNHQNLSDQWSGCPTNSYTYTFTSSIFVRYDQKKLLTWSSATNQDEIFLDYNLKVDDTITNVGFTNVFGSNLKLPVTNIDSVLINGIYLKRFYYDHPMGTKYIMEKIGSIQGFLNTYSYDFESGSLLNCYSENAVTLYNEPSSTATCELTLSSIENNKEDLTITLFPNPTSHEFMIASEKSHQIIHKMTIKNYLGQIIQATEQPKSNFNYDISFLKNGLYFVELKTETGTILKKIVKQ
jgi:hypothetical protein